MITANATQYPDHIELAITYPERKRPVYKYVINRKEANIVVYALYRNYIFKKLSAYLKQRAWCLQLSDKDRVKDIHKLQVLLAMFEKGTLRNICRFAHRHWEQFTDVAPGKKSRYHKHYITRIIPVLNFCDEIGGAE